MRAKAFTLIELSLVLLVVSLLTAAALRYTTARNDISNANALNATLDAIDAATLNYRAAYNRLPCPADITQAENYSTFGVEVDYSGIGSGNCNGANLSWSGGFAAGAVPTKTLRLADKYAYDPWGRKIEYGVDIRMTAINAFITYPIYYKPLIPRFTINNSYGVSLIFNTFSAPNRPFYPIYILISFGKNGHGGFMRNVNTTCTLSTCPIFNYGSTNTDELANCNCTKAAVVSATYPISTTPAFVQDTPNATNGGASGTTFDDVVRYKTRAQMATTAELQ